MMSLRKKIRPLLLGTLMLALTGTAYASSEVELGYVQSWPSSALTTKLAAQAIRDNLDQKVKLQALTAGPMYQAVKQDNIDGLLTAWLPKTHASYYKKMWPDLINMGPNLVGTRLGMAVPQYVDADSITDLKGHEGKFDHQVIGVGSGAGVNINTKDAIKAYGLDMHLTSSSTAAMAASLKRAIDHHKPIVVTGWSPLWIWSKFKLKYLKDPKNIYGQSGHVSTLVNPALAKKSPEVFQFLNRFYIKLSDLNGLEEKVQGGMSQDDAVKQWLADHKTTVDGWFAGISSSS